VNWEAIGAIGQIVGAIAVVISLIYLAREIRSNARSARMASVGTLNQWFGQLARHPHLAELWTRGVQDYESVEGADRTSFNVLLGGLFRIFEEMYYQRLDGHLDPRLWREVETPMRDMINRFPGIQAWWREFSDWFGDEKFVNYVNQLQQTAKRPSLYREPDAHQ
jgi:hypothetical protein